MKILDCETVDTLFRSMQEICNLSKQDVIEFFVKSKPAKLQLSDFLMDY